MSIELKRIYDPPHRHDGYRVLVDRVWPRGVSKQRAAVDLWCKEIAPSTDLRRWFDHDPAKWPEFRARYFAELRDKRELLKPIERRSRRGRVSLLYASRERCFNNAAALKAYLEQQLR